VGKSKNGITSKRSLGVLVAAGVAAVASLGVLAGSILFPAAAPASLARSSQPESIAVTYRDYRDIRNVNVTVHATSEQLISSPIAGVIVSSNCTPGGIVESGSPLLEINDMVLIALATEVPLWRDLALGDRGADVSALNQELARLGFPISTIDRVTSATIRAVNDLLSTNENLGTDVVLRNSFVWIPDNNAVIASCSASVGNSVAPGTPLVTLTPQLKQVTVDLPANLVPGDRIVRIGGNSFNISDSGEIPHNELAEFAASGVLQFATAAGPGVQTLNGQIELETPVSAAVAPPVAIFGMQGNQACVLPVGASTATPVTILGSELGQTFLLPNNGESLHEISLNTHDVQCPYNE